MGRWLSATLSWEIQCLALDWCIALYTPNHDYCPRQNPSEQQHHLSFGANSYWILPPWSCIFHHDDRNKSVLLCPEDMPGATQQSWAMHLRTNSFLLSKYVTSVKSWNCFRFLCAIFYFTFWFVGGICQLTYQNNGWVHKNNSLLLGYIYKLYF